MKWIKTFVMILVWIVFYGVSTLYADQQNEGDKSQHLKTGVYFFKSGRENKFFELKSNGTVINDDGSAGTYKVHDGKLVNTYKDINERYINGVLKNEESVYNITYNIKAGILIRDNYYSYKLWKESSTREEYASHNGLWLAVRPGSSVYGFALNESRMVYLNSKFLFRFNRAEGMYISPLSPSKRYRAVVSWDFDKGGIQLLIVDMQTGLIAASDGKNGGQWVPSFYQWISWSPDERYALASPGGEGVRELMHIDLKTKIAKDVPLKRFEKEYEKGIKEVQLTDIHSVKWIDNQRYRVLISLYCNIYDDEKCKPNNPSRTYETLVNIEAEKIEYKQVR
jgi:hypothetical protein